MSREGDEGDHLEGGANLETSAAIVALASKLPALVVERGVAGKGGGGGVVKGSEFGHEESNGDRRSVNTRSGRPQRSSGGPKAR